MGRHYLQLIEAAKQADKKQQKAKNIDLIDQVIADLLVEVQNLLPNEYILNICDDTKLNNLTGIYNYIFNEKYKIIKNKLGEEHQIIQDFKQKTKHCQINNNPSNKEISNEIQSKFTILLFAAMNVKLEENYLCLDITEQDQQGIINTLKENNITPSKEIKNLTTILNCILQVQEIGETSDLNFENQVIHHVINSEKLYNPKNILNMKFNGKYELPYDFEYQQ